MYITCEVCEISLHGPDGTFIKHTECDHVKDIFEKLKNKNFSLESQLYQAENTIKKLLVENKQLADSETFQVLWKNLVGEEEICNFLGEYISLNKVVFFAEDLFLKDNRSTPMFKKIKKLREELSRILEDNKKSQLHTTNEVMQLISDEVTFLKE